MSGAGDVLQALPEESAEDLYENAPCGYLSALPDGTIVRVNATFLAWTGYAREELVGRRRFQELLTAGGRIYHETHYAPLLRMQDAVREIALELVRADGRPLPVLVNSLLRRDPEGRPALVRTTVFNASDRRQYERELVRAREREHAARERVERLQRITAALAATLAPRAIARLVVEEIMRIDLAERAAVALLEDGSLRALAAVGFEAAAVERWTGEGGLAAGALGRGQPAFAEDGDELSAALPLLAGGRPVGGARRRMARRGGRRRGGP